MLFHETGFSLSFFFSPIYFKWLKINHMFNLATRIHSPNVRKVSSAKADGHEIL